MKQEGRQVTEKGDTVLPESRISRCATFLVKGQCQKDSACDYWHPHTTNPKVMQHAGKAGEDKSVLPYRWKTKERNGD